MASNLGKFIEEQVGPELAKRGITEADIALVAEKGGVSAIGMIVDAIEKCVQQVTNVFRIVTGDNRTTDEVIAAGNYDVKSDWVNGKNFSMRSMPEGPREIVFLEFDHDPSSEEVLAEAARQGLERPRHEDALFFGEQHPEEQCNGPIVFLHEPWPDPRRSLRVLVLFCCVGCRDLDLDFFGGRWHRPCRFAFVRK